MIADPEAFRGRTVLVTGASGFIGSHLVQRLSELGADVHALARAGTGGAPFATWHRFDLAAPDQDLSRLVSELAPATIFHLASHVVGARDRALVWPTLRANLDAAVRVLDAATACDARVVLAGSLEEPESGVAVPSSPYAAAKLAASSYGRMYHALWNTDVRIARIFMVYGPGQRDLRKLVPYVTLSLLRGEAPRISSGSRPVDWIYVGDVVSGLVALASHPDRAGDTVDLGSGELVTVRDVVARLAAIVGSGVELGFGAVAERPLEQVRTARREDTRNRLGWEPETSLEQGLAATVRFYREELERGGIA